MKFFSGNKTLSYLLFSFLMVFYCARTAKSDAVIMCESDRFNFGTMETDKSYSHNFLIRNSGDKALKIISIRPSCGCIGRAFSKESVVQPGKSTVINVRFDSSSYRKNLGEYLEVMTNDPKTPKKILYLKGTIVPVIAISPTVTNFGILSPEELPASQTVRIVDYMPDSKTNSLDVENSSEIIDSKLIDNKDGTWSLKLDLKKNVPIGPIATLLTLKPNWTKPKNLLIIGRVIGDVFAEPEEVNVLFPKTKKLSTEVSLKGRESKISHSEVAAISENLSQFVKVVLKNGKANITVDPNWSKVPASTPMIKGAVVFNTASLDGSSHQLRVPINLSIPIAPPKSNSGDASPLLPVGKLAPEFSVTDFDGREHKLSGLRGHSKLLLTFFPKCHTGNCANQLISLQEYESFFQANHIQVIGVSVDSGSEQRIFAKQLGLDFPLIPDTKRVLSMMYGAVKSKSELDSRMSVLIDEDGIVRLIDQDVQVETHGKDMIGKMADLGLVNASFPASMERPKTPMH